MNVDFRQNQIVETLMCAIQNEELPEDSLVVRRAKRGTKKYFFEETIPLSDVVMIYRGEEGTEEVPYPDQIAVVRRNTSWGMWANMLASEGPAPEGFASLEDGEGYAFQVNLSVPGVNVVMIDEIAAAVPEKEEAAAEEAEGEEAAAEEAEGEEAAEKPKKGKGKGKGKDKKKAW